MALSNSTFIACSLFLSLLIILTWEIQSVDARLLVDTSELQNLQTDRYKSVVHHDTETSKEVIVSPPTSVTPPQTGVAGAAQPPPPAHGIDDFRPTAPGHSPGVGHSTHN